MKANRITFDRIKKSPYKKTPRQVFIRGAVLKRIIERKIEQNKNRIT